MQAVLIVDDEPSIRFLMSALLEQAGFRPIAAASVDEALAVVRSHPLSLVVSDYELGARNGIDLLLCVREEHPTLPFVLVSADFPPGAADLALRSGAQRALGKNELVAELVGLAEQLAAA
jgi:DNA-binding NtrC family response regulator